MPRLSALNHVVFRIDDLGRSDLGWARQGVITLDRTADGDGWFVDPTPGDDSDFAPVAVNSPAGGHIDLLSVVAHEMGHLLGYGEDESDGVTGEYLGPASGTCRLPPSPVPRPVSDARLPVIKLASSSIGGSSLVKPQAAANPRLTGTSDGLMALAPLADRAACVPRTASTRPARAPQAAVSGPGLPDWSRLIWVDRAALPLTPGWWTPSFTPRLRAPSSIPRAPSPRSRRR